MESHVGDGLKMVPRILVPVGYGLNCEDETSYAFEMVGAEVNRIFLKDLIDKPDVIENYHMLAMIGGFSFGDHIAAGKVLGNIYKYKLGEEIQHFIEEDKLIFAECNGFQTLVKAGILPGLDGDYKTQRVTLTQNDSGVFEDRWVKLKVNLESNCVFTKGLDKLYLPVRHGEGKFVADNPYNLLRLREGKQIVLQYADYKGEPTMSYPQNPNGSMEAIAGICDPTGRVFGKMPHATAFLNPYNHPHWTRLKAQGKLTEEGGGVQVFRNAVEYIKKKLI